MFHTIGYKYGFIHIKTIDGNEYITVQVNQFAYAIEIKSIRAAKILITKHNAKV